MSESAVPETAPTPPSAATPAAPARARAAVAKAEATSRRIGPPPAQAAPAANANAHTAARPKRTRMSLDRVVAGKLAKPMRVLVYGPEGVGKSTFAAAAPAPIFLGAEDGTSELDVQRFPEPRRWEDILEAVDELIEAEHAYQTVVIDTLDWVEPLCWHEVCTSNVDKNGRPFQSIEGLGYGKGYKEALVHWRLLSRRLESLREKRRMHVVLLAHSWIRTFKNPAGEDFDRYEMKLDKNAGGLWREWSDAVLFATDEIATYKANQHARAKGIMSGARVLYSQRTAAYEAKNRYDLPATLPLDWTAFAEAVAAHRPDDPQRLCDRIEHLLAAYDEDESDTAHALRERVRRSVANAGDDAAELARIENKLQAQVSKDQQEASE